MIDKVTTLVQWIIAGEHGWVADLLRACMAKQKKILMEFPESEKKKGYGFACRLMVGKREGDAFDIGEGGGIFDLWFCEQGLQPKPPEIPLRNVIVVSEQTLMDMVSPDLTAMGGFAGLADFIDREGMEGGIPKLRPRLYMRKALANQSFEFAGEQFDLDSEMWAQIFDKALYEIAFPIVVQGLIARAQETKGREKRRQ